MSFNLVGMPRHGPNEGRMVLYPFPSLDTALVNAQRMLMSRCLFVEIQDDGGSTMLNERAVRAEIKARNLDS